MINKKGLTIFLIIFLISGRSIWAAQVWVEQDGQLTKVSDTNTISLKRTSFKLLFAPLQEYVDGRNGIRVLAYPQPIIWNLSAMENQGGWLQGMADYNDDEGIMLSEASNFWAHGSGLKRLSMTTIDGRRYGVRRIDSFYIVGSPFELPDVKKRFKPIFTQLSQDVAIGRYPHNELYLTVIYNHKNGEPVDRKNVVRLRIRFQ